LATDDGNPRVAARVDGWIDREILGRSTISSPLRDPCVSVVRRQLPGVGLLVARRALDGDRPHVRSAQRDPRHGLRGQNIGIIGAAGVGSYIALAGMWGSPISGTSMNPARTFGPGFVGGDLTSYWIYVAGPLLGMLIAVGAAFVLRGRGGGHAGSAAAQGVIDTEVQRPEQG
jgi:hypothetical protein